MKHKKLSLSAQLYIFRTEIDYEQQQMHQDVATLKSIIKEHSETLAKIV